ncbi:UMP kinase [Thioalkalivibrio sp. ALMg11]|uniref:UMP kinase n=1 Tax=Thioalkalivibrio sp. ALMg11 TaxID=1158165 RepID=UPI000381933F|nr:UMP kinase [Thioalkalivibrio sp. ALMg11]
MSQDSQPAFRRILLKLSGEALMGQQSYGVDPDVLAQVAEEVSELSRMGVELGIVIGGGNIFRGAGLAQGGMDRVTGDHMGMLATVINALALQDAIERAGRFSRVMSAIRINQVCEDYIRRRAVRHLEKGRIVVFAAGTGNPFFTTDSAASLRAIEINADIMIKATKVDGVYDADPMTTKDARRYERLTFDDALEQRLGVMDTTALVMCRDNGLPIRVMNMFAKGDLQRLVMGEAVGTLVEGARNE